MPKRSWKRFSLRTLMSFCVVCSLLIAWLSLAAQQYRAEQRIIERLAKTLPDSEYFSVVTNGQSVGHGSPFL
ncbi:MAG: hypothetical protein WBD20_24985 [Pirellulaceae bacterium]